MAVENTCDIQARELGFDDDQRALIHREVSEYAAKNTKLTTAISRYSETRDAIEKLRLERNSETEIKKGNREALDTEINKRKEELNKIGIEEKTILEKEFITKKGELQDEIKKHKEGLESILGSDKKSLTDVLYRNEVLNTALEDTRKRKADFENVSKSDRENYKKLRNKDYASISEEETKTHQSSIADLKKRIDNNARISRSFKEDVSGLQETIKSNVDANRLLKKEAKDRVDARNIKASEKKAEHLKVLKDLKSQINEKRASITERSIAFRKESASKRLAQREESNKKINDLRSQISDLRDFGHAQREVTSEARKAANESKTKITRKFFNNDSLGIKRTNFQEKIKKDPEFLSSVLDQLTVSQHNLYSGAEHYENILATGLEEPNMSIMDPKDLTNPNTLEYIQKFRDRINAHSLGMGIFDKLGFTHANQHPVAINSNIIKRLLFKGWKTRESEEGFDEFKRDVISRIGNDNFQKHIEVAYKNEDIPTVDEAFENFRKSHYNGSDPKIFRGSIEFKSPEDASYFIPKYSGLDVVGNYKRALRRAAKSLSASRFGGYIDDTVINRADITDKKKIILKLYRDKFFGDANNSSMMNYKINKVINPLISLTVGAKAIPMVIAPFTDGARFTAINAIKYGSPDSLPHLAESLGTTFMKGVADVPKSFGRSTRAIMGNKAIRDELAPAVKVFGDVNDHIQDRSGILLNPIAGKLSLTQHIGKYFEHIDAGLVLQNAKTIGNILRKYKNVSIEDLPKGLNEEFDRLELNQKDWGLIQDALKDKNYLLSSEFNDELGFKVANLMYNNALDATPAKIHIPNATMAMWTKENPISGRLLGLFWSFTIKGMVGAYKNAYRYGGKSAVLNMVLHQGSGGMFPNLLYGYMTGILYNGNFDPRKMLEDPYTYIDAFSGSAAHLTSTSFSSIFNPSSTLYSYNPALTTGIRTASSIKDLANIIFGDTPDVPKFFRDTFSLAMGFTPVFGGVGVLKKAGMDSISS